MNKVDFVWITIEKVGVLIIRLLTLMIMARILLPKDFGLFAIGNVIISISNIIIDSGLSGAIIQRKNLTKEYIDTAFSFNVIVGCVVSIVIWLFSNYISDYYNQVELKAVLSWLSLTVILKSLLATNASMSTRNRQFKKQALLSICSVLLGLAISVYFGKHNYHFMALVYAQLIEAAILFIGYFSITKYVPRIAFSYKSFIEMYSFGGRLMMSSLIYTIYSNITTFILGKIYGVNNLGFYSQSQKINDMYSNVITLIIDKAIFPALSRKSCCEKSFKAGIEEIIPFISSFSFFIPVMIILHSDYIVHVVLGEGWEETARILKLMSFALFGVIIESYCRSFLKSYALSKVILKQEWIKRTIGILLIFLASLVSVDFVLYTIIAISILNACISIYIVDISLGISMILQCKLLIKSMILIGVFVTSTVIVNSLSNQEILSIISSAFFYWLFFIMFFNKGIKND